MLILDLESRRVNLLKSSITYLDTTIEHSTALFTPEVILNTEVKITSQSVNGPIRCVHPPTCVSFTFLSKVFQNMTLDAK